MKTMEMPKWLLENETSNDTFNQDIVEKFRHHKAIIQDDTEHVLHILWADEKDPKRNAINYILDKDNGVFYDLWNVRKRNRQLASSTTHSCAA